MSGYGVDVDRDMIAAWAEDELQKRNGHRSNSLVLRRQAANWVWYSVILCLVGLAFPVIYAAVALGYVLYGYWRYRAWEESQLAASHGAEHRKWLDVLEVW